MRATRADPANLAEGFDRALAHDPDGVALRIDDEAWTRRDIADFSARALATLVNAGVKPGGKVVAQYDTTPEDIALAVAAARLGATLMPIPKRLGVREINFLLERSEASFFAHVGDRPPQGVAVPKDAVTCSISKLCDASPLRLPSAHTTDEFIALIGVTSGSTGMPKGVMHNWRGVAWAAARMRALANVQPGEAVLVTGAGAGAPGFTFFTYLGLVAGATLVRASKWDPVQVLTLAHAHKCVWSTMVPTVLQMLLDARPAALGDGRLQHMRAVTVGGGFMSPGLIERARAELGVEVLRMYAMAECMANCSTLLSDEVAVRDTLDGAPGDGAEIAIFDDEGRRQPVGAIGEIGLRGASLLQGYLADPDGKQRMMTHDGFFLSGDLGRLDARGYVKVVGRKKDIINRGGYKIDPTEVEELIKSHPAVAKVVVVGYPDGLYGERACAVVETRPGASFAFDEMVEFLLGHGLSKEKLPEQLQCRAALPLSPDGKILRSAVKAQISGDAGFKR